MNENNRNLVTEIWPVQNFCPECGYDKFKVFSKREDGKTVVLRLTCDNCDTTFDCRK